MTHDSPAPPDAETAGNDQARLPFGYGGGRMPFFMKIVWLLFLGFATWYVVSFLLTSVGQELGK